jgi:hypothetical protein
MQSAIKQYHIKALKMETSNELPEVTEVTESCKQFETLRWNFKQD